MKNAIVGLKELRENTEKYINKIRKGQSFVVVSRSKPAFNIIPVDEWGDEGVWETVANFKQLFPHGVSAKCFHRALKKSDG